MSSLNATITSYERRTGTTGSGEPAFEQVQLDHPIPVVITPRKRSHAHSETSESERPEWMISVRMAALTAAGITPEVDDRVTVARTAPSTQVETFDLASVDDDDVAYLIDLVRRRDDVEAE